MNDQLILASTSSIRRSLLTNAGVKYEAVKSPINEETEKLKHSNPEKLAINLAIAKAITTSTKHPTAYVIGADQTLLTNNQIMSKPKSPQEARAQLLQLRGKTHVLISALAITKTTEILWQYESRAILTMRDFSDDFLDEYLNTGSTEALTSSGCYKLEGRGIQLFSKIEGDYFTILGLPLLPLITQLRAMNLVVS